MLTIADALFLEEVREKRLAYTCERCAHFDEERDACSHGYSVREHKARALEVRATVTFCKEWELA